MKTYTEVHDKSFRNITIYPFVPEGTPLKGFEGNIVISLLDLKVKWNFTLRDSITRDQWAQLNTAMQRAFDITDWTNEDIVDYIRGMQ